MTAGMNMFRRRSLQIPTPYKSDRICFFDPSIAAVWACQYNLFVANEKKYKFPDDLKQVFRGEQPPWCQTKKVWFRDVDTIYIAHNINNIHWVALEVDLLKQRIKVYDSNQNAVPSERLNETLKPYARMIPYLAREMSPKEHTTVKAYTIYKVKALPFNEQSGDCGVYTLKFIELLALGCGFSRLQDCSVAFIRLKFAIEIMDELPIPETISPTDPYPRHEIDKKTMIAAAKGLLLEWKA